MTGESRIVVEHLYPEFGNQGGDNGNVMYLKACLPTAHYIETHFRDELAFVTQDVSMLYLGYMTERQQQMVAKRLMPYRERLVELVEKGCVVLFTGNAAELLGERITMDSGETYRCLGLFDFFTKQSYDHREPRVYLGRFHGDAVASPLEVVGYHIGFSSLSGAITEPFCEDVIGSGLSVDSTGEGLRRKNLIATWLCGPLLPLNPPLTSWLLTRLGADGSLAFETEVRAAYRKRIEEFRTPGIRMPI